jgi:hypothetical protein
MRSSAILTFGLLFVVWFHKKIGTWKKIDAYICLTPLLLRFFSNLILSFKRKFIVKPILGLSIVDNKFAEESHFLFVGRLSEEKESMFY